MILLVGLGNPGEKYSHTRHNVGFMLIDALLSNGGFSDVSGAKFQGELYKKGSLLLLKPQTFMNLSGNSVKAVCDFYKPDRVIVIHDDIDLALGAIKFKLGGSAGGHNGLKSIDNLIGTKYERVRIGVGKKPEGWDAANFVLAKFGDDDREKLSQILEYAKKAVNELIHSDIDEISQKFTIKKVAQ
ncbi:aminoacyl-tRNA hydrolase [Campylobacter sp. VBCF_05 NA6]|uniref:aminoacyl-tRNA hydrolase n=1 Tax=unclassified Campylobacter TaxID=2593542 RepID=UPI0022E9FFDF|nr:MULTISPECIES: aminoacyl-tRNA hydrolase [unclassified Campylobacter]MDA3057961.1 aminoacyl-tRNA hydrolase [Campylobacter sp. VBCF_04 NA7]MDA3059262.1 aminoacyl-tRNA hydrolase [Campylobacter sp. VBCF_05 NA6]